MFHIICKYLGVQYVRDDTVKYWQGFDGNYVSAAQERYFLELKACHCMCTATQK